MDDAIVKYQAITRLPEHLERKLLQFNILQLCALVSEKSGAKWTGASDRYGPIQEIAKRWDPEELFQRITDIEPEDPQVSYAKVMTAIGGNPTRETVLKHRQERGKRLLEERMAPTPIDAVRAGLEHAHTIEDLRVVAAEQGLGPLNWTKIEGLKNFGLKRMYIGNAWRTKIRRDAKSK